ncbi:tyrosine-type recombinase/integrase, partial [Streptomyces sp. NEAU-H3]|uniref:tyrosine-type recombinase/integrase n=1 Tax=Streptomyces sp. NEAU-H3 TaxID=2720636 RepID=UPI00280B02E5
MEEIRPLVAQRILVVGPDPSAPPLHRPPRRTHLHRRPTRRHTLGYEHLRSHDLRHTGPTWFADAGTPVHILRRIADHGFLNTTQRYLRPTST